MKLIGLFFAFLSVNALAGKNVALVKILRGKAEMHVLGKKVELKMEDWVQEDSVIKTLDKSFVKLVFLDKSQMNVGPDSEMKIEKFDGKEAGVIDFVKGKIRSHVTKDYLQIKDHDKSKLFIKTKNAVMGVRGTDFMVTTNGASTATVLFEGEIVFNNLTEFSGLTSAKLETIVDNGVKIMPGEFSVVDPSRPEPTIPSVLNIKQLETLEGNQNFESDRSPSSTNAAAEPTASVVPDGLSGEAVSNSSDTLKAEVSQIGQVEAAPVTAASDAQGFASGDTVKPANGSFLHLESGTIIPPAANSIFDANTNSFLPAPGNGKVDASGNFQPPANVAITNDGKIMMNVSLPSGEVKVVEVAKPAPVVAPAAMSLTQVSQVVAQNPTLLAANGPVTTAPAPVAPPVAYRPPTNVATSGGIDLNTAVIQRTNGRLSIDVIK